MSLSHIFQFNKKCIKYHMNQKLSDETANKTKLIFNKRIEIY